MKRFKNKNILVTGGSRGIGESIVRRFVLEGARVFFTYNSNGLKAKKIESELSKEAVSAYRLDVTDYKKIESLVRLVEKLSGGIDILINNAGITIDKPINEMQQSDFRNVIDANLISVFNLSKAIIPYMSSRNKGVIVNVSSVSAIKGVAFQTNYSAAKAGILGFSRSLSKETARFNIKVNTVCPGFIETDMYAKLHPFVKNNVLKAIPLGRIGKPEEVAGLVAYLASDEASYITGQFFVIDGGMSV